MIVRDLYPARNDRCDHDVAGSMSDQCVVGLLIKHEVIVCRKWELTISIRRTGLGTSCSNFGFKFGF